MVWIIALVGNLVIIICLTGVLYRLHIERRRLEAENWLLQQLVTILRQELRKEQARQRRARPLILNGRPFLTYVHTRLPFGRN